MAQIQDIRQEEMKLVLNRSLLKKYGNNLVLSKIKEKGLNNYTIEIDYNKIFHIFDNKSNTIFVRNLKFKNIYQTKLKYLDDLNLPLDEINSSIKSEYEQIRFDIIHRVLSNRDLIISLIKNTHLFSAFLNKFYSIINQLVIGQKISKSTVVFKNSKDGKYDKYLKLVIDEGFAEIDSLGNIIATNKLNLLHKKTSDVKKTVDETLYLIIKNNYDYIVYNLNLYTLRSYVNIISCLIYLKDIQKLSNIRIKLYDLYKIFLSFYQKVDFDIFQDRINNLVYSNIMNSDGNYIQLTT
jgi:hypothetical protein